MHLRWPFLCRSLGGLGGECFLRRCTVPAHLDHFIRNPNPQDCLRLHLHRPHRVLCTSGDFTDLTFWRFGCRRIRVRPCSALWEVQMISGYVRSTGTTCARRDLLRVAFVAPRMVKPSASPYVNRGEEQRVLSDVPVQGSPDAAGWELSRSNVAR